jgi:hypothetical protein
MQQYASAPMDASTAAAWRDLYIGTVGAGASLTGLTFVAIALDPHQIERTPLLRLRAANALWCFVSVMFIGLAVLTPRPFTTWRPWPWVWAVFRGPSSFLCERSVSASSGSRIQAPPSSAPPGTSSGSSSPVLAAFR